MSEPIHILSLGAGVQSSTLAFMAALKVVTPMPHCAVFADTKFEPASVYEWLDYLDRNLPFPIHRVSRGSLEEAALVVRVSMGGKSYAKHSIPAFIADAQGECGLAMRQCTSDFKIEVIQREIKRIIGKGGSCIQWIGISSDEAHRMKQSRKEYIVNRWPLIEIGMTRRQCLKWMKEAGFKTPPRSSCVVCPYHSNNEWRRLKSEEPAEFKRAVEWEKKYQKTMSQVTGFRGTPYLHRSLVPLADVDLSEADSNQSDLFSRECMGMCGV